jgi:mannitol/fructose-specific phosphotransferase system IIA component (Ntr-type)
MKNLLHALQEGRFVELPETNKEKALNYLANLIEAMPDLRPGTDVAGAVMAREAQFNTAIGMGWACPHMRSSADGDMICAAGWSPHGIDYGAPDQKPVHFVIMYYVPDSQKHVYLKEISSLAKAIQHNQKDQDISKMQTLAEARDWVLDLVSTALETQVSEAKARMIHLEARQAVATCVTDASAVAAWPLPAVVVPLSILVAPGLKAVVLAQDQDTINRLESAAAGDLETALAKQAPFELGGYRILFRSVAGYQSRRLLYDCLAVKLSANGALPADKPKS